MTDAQQSELSFFVAQRFNTNVFFAMAGVVDLAVARFPDADPQEIAATVARHVRHSSEDEVKAAILAHWQRRGVAQ